MIEQTKVTFIHDNTHDVLRYFRYGDNSFKAFIRSTGGVLLCCLLLMPCLGNFLYAQEQPHMGQKRVLLLNSYHKGYLWTDEITRGIEETIVGGSVDLHVEYMDTKRQFDAVYQNLLIQVLSLKHGRHQYDVIITSDNNAFSFYREFGKKIYGNIPLVFCGVNYLRKEELEGFRRVTGVNEQADISGNLALIKRLHPDCRRIVIITDNTTTGKRIQERVIFLKSKRGRGLCKIDLLYDITISDLGRELRNLDDHTVVLFTFFFRDKSGTFFEFDRGAQFVCENASVPVYGAWNFSLGYGIVGGYLISGFEQGAMAAGKALSILSGQSAGDIPVSYESPTHLRFDFRQLQRHGISSDILPPGHEILYQPVSFYDRHKRLIRSIVYAFCLLLPAFLGVSYGLIRSRQATGKLRKSEEEYRRIVENLGREYFFYAYDTDGVFFYVSPSLTEMLGYGKEEFMTHYSTYLTDNPVNDDVTGKTEESIRGIKQPPYLVEIFHKSGDPFLLEITDVPIFNEDGKVVAVEGIAHDITERKRVENELRINEKRYRTLVENIPGITYRCACDEHWTMEFFGNDVETLSGYPASDFIRNRVRSYASIIHPGDRQMVNDVVMQGVDRKKPFIIEYRVVRADGELRWVFEKGQGVFSDDGQLLCLDGVIIDITESKQAEDELYQLRRYLSNIIDSMPSVLVGVDAAGRVTQWNKTVEQTTGIAAETAQGKILSDVFPRMASEMEKIAESIRTREAKHELKKPRQFENGTCYEDIIIYPLIANGVEGAVVRIDDVTEKVRMEEMMIQSEKMLSVGGLAAGMAHEINNPMAGMIQTADVMSNRLTNMEMPANRRAAEKAGIAMENIREFMETRGIPQMLTAINETGRRVAEIVDNMLNFARKSDSLVSFHDIEDLLDKTLELAVTDFDLKKHYDFKLIGIKKEYEENLPNVLCEGAKIQQVLLNLLRNGAQAMQESGTENPQFIVRTIFEKDRKMVCMEIEDNGPGMTEATRKRVFEPFFTTKPVGVGTGLGLSVSYFIITENHGGEMEVDSAPGSGAKFIIRLPLEEGKG